MFILCHGLTLKCKSQLTWFVQHPNLKTNEPYNDLAQSMNIAADTEKYFLHNNHQVS